MIENKLTDHELRRIISPIIQLESMATVLPEIARVFDIDTINPDDIVCQSKYLVTFKNYKVDITFLDTVSENGVSVAIQFKLKQKWWHVFINPNRAITNYLKRICYEEFFQLKFKQYNHSILETRKEPRIDIIYFHDDLAYNGKWEEGFEISPLIIAENAHHGNLFVEFHFNASRYQRIKNKTILKLEWKKFIQDVVKYINKEATRRLYGKK